MNYSLSHKARYRAARAARNINRKCKVWKWRKQIVEFLREGCFHLFPHEHHCVDRNTKLSHFLLLFELARKLRMTMIITVYNSTQRHFFFFLLTGCDWNQTESGAMHHARKCFIWKETHGKLLWIKMIFRGNMVKFWDFCPFWQIFYNFIIADLELKIFVFKCQPQQQSWKAYKEGKFCQKDQTPICLCSKVRNRAIIIFHLALKWQKAANGKFGKFGSF